MSFMLLIASCGNSNNSNGSGETTGEEKTSKVVNLTHLTTPSGIGEYEWGLMVDKILNDNSSWLRQNTLESQGYIYNFKTMVDDPKQRETLVINVDPITPWLASQKKAPFEDGMKDVELQTLYNSIWLVWSFVTEDPNIKSIEDLAGKRVALGGKAGTATAIAEEVLKAAGVYDQLESIEYLNLGEIGSALLDGRVDAGICNASYNAVTNKVRPATALIDLEASGREFRYLEIDEQILDKTINERGCPIRKVVMPGGTLPMQSSEDILLYVNPNIVGVDKSFPEEYAYEHVKALINNVDVLNSSGGMGVLFSKEFLCYEVNNLHPGAKRAYEEAGLLNN